MSIMVVHRDEDWVIPKRYFSLDNFGKPIAVYIAYDGSWYDIVEKDGKYHTVTA